MAHTSHHRSPSDNSPAFFNTHSVTAQTHHPPQDVQQPPLTITNRSYQNGRLSPSAGGNNGRHTPSLYGPPIIEYTQPADIGGYNTNLGFQPNTPNLHNQQSNVQSATGFLNHGQADVSADPVREAPWNQVCDIAQIFRGAQEHDTFSNSLTAFPRSYEQRSQLCIPQAIEPSSRPQTQGFLHEDPTDPRNTDIIKAREKDIQNQREREYPQGREKRKDEQRDHTKKLIAIGGACFTCHRSKKVCDLKLNCSRCQQNGLICVRVFETLSLYNVNLNSSDGMGLIAEDRQAIIDNVKRISFANIGRIIRELNSQTSPQAWEPEAVLVFRCAQPDSSSAIALDTTLVTNFLDSDALPASLEGPLLKMMPASQFPHLPNLESSSILQSATLMLQQFALIISITHAEFYAIPGHFFSGRATLVFVLAYLANAVAEESQQFVLNLKRLLWEDRKEPEKRAESPHNVWLAIGVYYNIVHGLYNFEPPSLVTEVFLGMKNGLLEVCTALRHILEVTYKDEFGELDAPSPDEGVAGKAGIWMAFSQQVPLPLVLQSLDVAFYFSSQAPTALARQFAPFDSSPTAISELLSTDFYREFPTSIDPCLPPEIEEGRDMMPYGNSSSSALLWAPFRHHEQSSGADRDSRREVERDSFRISSRGTEVSGGEDSTLVAQSDAEDNHSVPYVIPESDYTLLNPNFNNIYYDLKIHDERLLSPDQSTHSNYIDI